MTRFTSESDWLTTMSGRSLDMAHFRVGANATTSLHDGLGQKDV